MNKPCSENICANFCATNELLCAWEELYATKVAEMIDAMKPDTTLIDALLEGISVYDCDDETLYQCDDVVLYPKDGKFYKSLKNYNDRDPQDSGSWEEYDSLKGMMSKIDVLTSNSLVSIPYHASCNDENCTALYDTGQCVAIKFDTGEIDSCGNTIYIDQYYISTEDRNTDIPNEPSLTWDGPFTPCDIFNISTPQQELQCEDVCNLLSTCPIVDSI